MSSAKYGGIVGGSREFLRSKTAKTAMPKKINPVAPSTIKNATPRAEAYKVRDGGGLYLLVKPEGGKLWRLDYRRPGTTKRNTLSLGVYPDVSLKQARDRRDEARKLLADGIDPGEKRKAVTDTFEAVAREWFAKHSTNWAPSHSSKIIRRLERDVFPWIGNRPVGKLKAPDVLAVLRRIESRGAIETAHRAHQNCGQVCRYAVATGRAEGDVTRDLRGALTPWKPENYASITDPAKVGELLRAIDGFTGTLTVVCALKLAPLVFVRPGELRQAKWEDFDLDAAEWCYHVTKTDVDHVVPLAVQAVAILRDLQPLTGHRQHVFPGRDPRKPMSDAALNAALRRMGYDKQTFTAHGFRAMARTILDEGLGFRVDIIEHQLAHAVKDANGRAYNRTAHLEARRKMMQAWADYLDTLRRGERKVVPIHSKA